MQRFIDAIETVDEYEEKSRRVLVWGAALILAGLIQGFFVSDFTNPRMALSAHVTAMQSGTLLLVVGLAWHRLQLSIVQLRLTYWTAVAGLMLVWLALTAAAVLGTSAITPIAGAGFKGSELHELMVTAILITGSLSSLFGFGLFFWGLELTTARRGRQADKDADS